MAKKNRTSTPAESFSTQAPPNPSVTAESTPQPETTADTGGSHERIAARAYELYLERGGGHGRATEDWFAAEREISGASKNGSEPSGDR